MQSNKLCTCAALSLILAVSPVHAGDHTKPSQAAQPHGPQASGKSAGSKTSTPTTTTTAPAPTTPPVSPIAQKISSHPQLAAKLKPMLPPNITLDQAASGFKNQGQFIAALHVSQNLGLSFTELKTHMVDEHLSLGQSIQAAKTTTDTQTATTAARRAEQEADDDIKSTTTTKSPATSKNRTGDHHTTGEHHTGENEQ